MHWGPMLQQDTHSELDACILLQNLGQQNAEGTKHSPPGVNDLNGPVPADAQAGTTSHRAGNLLGSAGSFAAGCAPGEGLGVS